MKKAILTICLMMGILGLAAASHAYTVTFESLSHDDMDIVQHGATYEEGGFLFTNTATVESSGFDPSFSTFGLQASGFTGSTALINDNWHGQTVLTTVGGGYFSIYSIGLAGLFTADMTSEVEFSGVKHDGTVVSQIFSVDNLLSMQNFDFNDGFQNIILLSWNQADAPIQFDNVNVAPVPIPGAVWLFGSGLLGLTGLKRNYFV